MWSHFHFLLSCTFLEYPKLYLFVHNACASRVDVLWAKTVSYCFGYTKLSYVCKYMYLFPGWRGFHSRLWYINRHILSTYFYLFIFKVFFWAFVYFTIFSYLSYLFYTRFCKILAYKSLRAGTFFYYFCTILLYVGVLCYLLSFI